MLLKEVPSGTICIQSSRIKQNCPVTQLIIELRVGQSAGGLRSVVPFQLSWNVIIPWEASVEKNRIIPLDNYKLESVRWHLVIISYFGVPHFGHLHVSRIF